MGIVERTFCLVKTEKIRKFDSAEASQLRMVQTAPDIVRPCCVTPLISSGCYFMPRPRDEGAVLWQRPTLPFPPKSALHSEGASFIFM